MSRVTCHVSRVTCHFFSDKVVKLIGGGSVINGAYPAQLNNKSPCVVVSGVLLAGHELLGVEELPVGAGPDLVHHRGLQVEEDGPGNGKSAPSPVSAYLDSRYEKSVSTISTHRQRSLT